MSIYNSIWNGTGARFEIDKSKDGKFFWHFKAENNETVCSSQEYASKQGAEKGIQALKDNINAAVDDKTKQAA